MQQRTRSWICFALGVVTFLIYLPVFNHTFVNYDDDDYVYENDHVQRGLTLAGIKWAFTTVHASNWHPLTWISHMLDVSVFGKFAGGHHLTSVLLHAGAAILLLLAFNRMTGRLWPSAIVAALFAWHPLRVESVAWVAERKDVLSLFFFGWLLNAYASYAERPTRARYALVLGLFALGLMAKPMLVTAPFLLLLLDYWPLNRLKAHDRNASTVTSSAPGCSWQRLAFEKLPFLLLALTSCMITVWAQHHGGAIKSTDAVPLFLRGLNAIVAYAAYLGKMILPLDLAVLYPLPQKFSALSVLGSVGLLAVLTAVAWDSRRTRPYLLVGWLWYLGTLVPVIGLVQVGLQAMADRYTYLPGIGILLLVVWTVADWMACAPQQNSIARALAVLLVAGCVVGSVRQLGYWRNSATLFERCVRIAPTNAIAWNNWGVGLSDQGRTKEAIAAFTEAVRLDPDYAKAHYNLGIDLANQANLPLAKFHFREALRLQPSNAVVHVNLGVILAQQRQFTNALAHFRTAISLKPDYARAHLNLALVLARTGRIADAVVEHRRALELDPESPEVLEKFAWLLATTTEKELRDGPMAVRLAEKANTMMGHQFPGQLHTLAAAYAAAGDFPKAITCAKKANAMARKLGLKELAAQTEKCLQLYRAGKAYYDARE